MAKTAERKLTSEERCRKAFEDWRGSAFNDMDGADALLYRAWQAAWKYLEQHVAEYIQS